MRAWTSASACADGALLDVLARDKAVDARGIELTRDKVNA